MTIKSDSMFFMKFSSHFTQNSEIKSCARFRHSSICYTNMCFRIQWRQILNIIVIKNCSSNRQLYSNRRRVQVEDNILNCSWKL